MAWTWCAPARSVTPGRARARITWSRTLLARSPQRRRLPPAAEASSSWPGTSTSAATSPTCGTSCARTGWRSTRPTPAPTTSAAEARLRSVTSSPRPRHGHHGPGRELPRRPPARKGIRGPRDGAPLLDRDVRAAHPHPEPDRPAHGRPARPALARRRDPRLRAARDLQPRRDVVRGGVVEPAGAHGRVLGRRGDAHARGDARGGAGGALLPGLLVRDVREGAGGAPARAHAVLPPQPLRRGEGVRALHHRQLPRELWPF